MKRIVALFLSPFLAAPALAVPPDVVVKLAPSVRGTTNVARMAPHGAFAYLDTSASVIHEGDWHDCDIAWKVTKWDGSSFVDIPDSEVSTFLTDPRPGAPLGSLDTRAGQKGYVCWYLFPTAGTYRFTCTVTNRGVPGVVDDNVGSDSVDVVVAADTRTYYYINPVSGSDTAHNGLSPSGAWQTWNHAQQAIGTSPNNVGLRIISQDTTSTLTSLASWDLSLAQNFLIESYFHNQFILDVQEPVPSNRDAILQVLNSTNVLIRDMHGRTTITDPYPPDGNRSVDAVKTAYGCNNVSVLNCTGTNLVTPFSADGGSTTDGVAYVNCKAINPGVNGAFTDGTSDVVVLGLSVENNGYSHALRLCAEDGTAYRGSVGYCDCDDNYSLLNTAHPEDHLSFKSYMPYLYAYNDYFRNGVVQIDRALATGQTTSNYRVFDACYFKNGKSDCATVVKGGINKIRFSGCIFELENNNLAHAGNSAYGPNNGYSAVHVTLADGTIDQFIMEGNTVLLGDQWPNSQGKQAIIRMAPPNGQTPTQITNVTVKNVLLVHDVAGEPSTFEGPFVLVPNEATGEFFKGNCWPLIVDSQQAPRKPFRIGVSEDNSTKWNFDQWYNGATSGQGQKKHDHDAEESNDRDSIIASSFLPNENDNPGACATSRVVRPSFTDYFGKRFAAEWHVTGAVVPPCLADYFADGFIDGIDYDGFMADYESTNTTTNERADLNQDGFTDGSDYDLFTAALERGCN